MLKRALLFYDRATLLFLWTAYRDHGLMPLAGGIFDQPAVWLDAMRVLNMVYARRVDDARAAQGQKEEHETAITFPTSGQSRGFGDLFG